MDLWEDDAIKVWLASTDFAASIFKIANTCVTVIQAVSPQSLNYSPYMWKDYKSYKQI